MRSFSHCKIEIDLGAAERNLRHIKEYIRAERPTGKRCLVCCVVKANAYGHGALPLARVFEQAGADALAVATLGEALRLRRGGISSPILILGETPPAMVMHLLTKNLLQTVHTLSYAEALSRAAERAGGVVDVHLKLDTGMCRLGFSREEAEDAARAAALSGLKPLGVFSHLASADDADGRQRSEAQLALFLKMSERLERERGPLCRHLANSAALLLSPSYHLDMVRPGLLLYGVSPLACPPPFPLSPVMRLEGRVTQVKRITPADRVGYGGVFCGESGYIATVSGGYADGFPRYDGAETHLPPCVECGGRCYPLAGRVSMDRLGIYSKNTPLSLGESVTLFGGSLTSVSALAAAVGRSPYEILCHTGSRIKKKYKK